MMITQKSSMILLILFIGSTIGQPQTYYKKDPSAKLPSKALPRIGRRSENNALIEFFPESARRNHDITIEDVEDDGESYLKEASAPPSNVLFVLKRLNAVSEHGKNRDVFRPEQSIGIH